MIILRDDRNYKIDKVEGRGLVVVIDKQDYPDSLWNVGNSVMYNDVKWTIAGIEAIEADSGGGPYVSLAVEKWCDYPNEAPLPNRLTLNAHEFVLSFHELWRANRLYEERFKEQCRIIEEKRTKIMELEAKLAEKDNG